jgi:mannose-6-phosphate isomerase-like protein (cupin superfamily)
MSAVNVTMSALVLLWLAVSPQTIPPPATQTPPPKPPPTQTTPPATQTPPPKPQTPATKPPGTSTSSAAAAKPAIVDLLVTTPAGLTIPGATVKADGPVLRQGTTGADGHVVFQNVNPGTYRFRIEHDSFVTLEKEVAVVGGSRAATQAALTPASKPAASAPPPVPAPAQATPALKPGEPRVLSLTDIAEQLLRAPDPIAERALGCSGATESRLIRVRESLAGHTHADADELLYIVAGDATLKLGDREQNISPGWFVVVPRGMSHSLTRRGRTPVLILSAVSGPPCQ